jgi:integrase
MFASPIKLGELPWPYPHIWREFRRAAKKAGMVLFGTHSLRAHVPSWSDAVETPIAVQQKLMRHADIRTTMNVYGDVVTNEMREAHSKIVLIALARPN